MFKRGEILSRNDKIRLSDALQKIQKRIRWKPDKDLVHLKKRQKMKHLSISASIPDYEKLILDIVLNDRNVVYLYEFNETHYYAIRGFSQNQEWLIIFGVEGVMETAFPPNDIDEYLEHRGFILLGHIEEVLKWTKEAKS